MYPLDVNLHYWSESTNPVVRSCSFHTYLQYRCILHTYVRTPVQMCYVLWPFLQHSHSSSNAVIQVIYFIFNRTNYVPYLFVSVSLYVCTYVIESAYLNFEIRLIFIWYRGTIWSVYCTPGVCVSTTWCQSHIHVYVDLSTQCGLTGPLWFNWAIIASELQVILDWRVTVIALYLCTVYVETFANFTKDQAFVKVSTYTVVVEGDKGIVICGNFKSTFCSDHPTVTLWSTNTPVYIQYFTMYIPHIRTYVGRHTYCCHCQLLSAHVLLHSSPQCRFSGSYCYYQVYTQ